MSLRRIRRETIVSVSRTAAVEGLRRLAEGRQLAVRPVCRVPALQAEITLLRDVVVTVEMMDDESCAVRWRPADGGPFPRFTGSLHVLGAGGGTWLRLDGSYEDVTEQRADPVDGALGFRLVQATASAVLDAVVNGLRSAEPVLHPLFSPVAEDELVTDLERT